ncbi:hypothetical protein [Tateyamaria sp. SN6-1]|uniref:hypothetical protein n=1 Tax=Tateyamaria sp. SN6-1 TaxID=3092148 RepID=UPI0039F5FCAB
MRVGFVGNSHLAAYKDALDDINADFPDRRLQFFGLRNPVFFQSPDLNGTALRLDEPLDDTGHQLINPEGAYPLPLGTFDAVLLTSHPFFFHPFAEEFAKMDRPGGLTTARNNTMVVTRALRNMIRRRARQYAVRLRQFFPVHDNMMVVQAPFPSIDVTALGGAFAYLAGHPAQDALFEDYQSILATVCVRRGLQLKQADPAVLTEPFFTKAKYARSFGEAQDTDIPMSDYIHMNASYARHSFARLMG